MNNRVRIHLFMTLFTVIKFGKTNQLNASKLCQPFEDLKLPLTEESDIQQIMMNIAIKNIDDIVQKMMDEFNTLIKSKIDQNDKSIKNLENKSLETRTDKINIGDQKKKIKDDQEFLNKQFLYFKLLGIQFKEKDSVEISFVYKDKNQQLNYVSKKYTLDFEKGDFQTDTQDVLKKETDKIIDFKDEKKSPLCFQSLNLYFHTILSLSGLGSSKIDAQYMSYQKYSQTQIEEFGKSLKSIKNKIQEISSKFKNQFEGIETDEIKNLKMENHNLFEEVKNFEKFKQSFSLFMNFFIYEYIQPIQKDEKKSNLENSYKNIDPYNSTIQDYESLLTLLEEYIENKIDQTEPNEDNVQNTFISFKSFLIKVQKQNSKEKIKKDKDIYQDISISIPQQFKFDSENLPYIRLQEDYIYDYEFYMEKEGQKSVYDQLRDFLDQKDSVIQIDQRDQKKEITLKHSNFNQVILDLSNFLCDSFIKCKGYFVEDMEKKESFTNYDMLIYPVFYQFIINFLSTMKENFQNETSIEKYYKIKQIMIQLYNFLEAQLQITPKDKQWSIDIKELDKKDKFVSIYLLHNFNKHEYYKSIQKILQNKSFETLIEEEQKQYDDQSTNAGSDSDRIIILQLI